MITRFRRWRRRRAYRVECEVCGARIRPKKAVVIDGFFATEDGPGLISATYCRNDAPKEHADA
jgi:hypothetical protein